MKAFWKKMYTYGAVVVKLGLPVLIEWAKSQVNRGNKK